MEQGIWKKIFQTENYWRTNWQISLIKEVMDKLFEIKEIMDKLFEIKGGWTNNFPDWRSNEQMDKLFLNSLSNGTLNIDKLFSNEGRNEEWTQKMIYQNQGAQLFESVA